MCKSEPLSRSSIQREDSRTSAVAGRCAAYLQARRLGQPPPPGRCASCLLVCEKRSVTAASIKKT
eukprot:2985080-Pleurochrysis_carterae.AAC.2